MKVLTLHQPWASLIALGIKTIETRGHHTNVRGRIAIHAAAHKPDVGWVGGWLVDRNRRDGSWMRRSTLDPSYRLPLGAIVATAELVDCVPILNAEDPDDPCGDMDSPFIAALRSGQLSAWWYANSDDQNGYEVTDQLPYGDFRPGRYTWMLADVRPLAVPIPFRGGQGWSRSIDESVLQCTELNTDGR